MQPQDTSTTVATVQHELKNAESETVKWTVIFMTWPKRHFTIFSAQTTERVEWEVDSKVLS